MWRRVIQLAEVQQVAFAERAIHFGELATLFIRLDATDFVQRGVAFVQPGRHIAEVAGEPVTA